MSENSEDRDLMVIVERIVRPVRASGRTKLRMRRELLAHVEEVFAEEIAAGKHRDAAVERAAQRLGSPEQVRESLQATVGFRDRYSYWADSLVMQRPGESRFRCSLRAGVTVGLLHLILTASGVLLAGILGRQTPLMVLPYLALLSAVFAVNMSVISLIGGTVADRFLNVTTERRKNLAVLVLGTIAIAAVLAGSEALLMAAADAGFAQLARLTAAAAAAALVLCPIVLLVYITERKSSLPWERLQFAER